MRFSLVVATLGRHKEVSDLLLSFAAQHFAHEDFEVIIADQNTSIDLSDAIEACKLPHIKHLRLDRKGLSHARNQGLAVASGEIVAFPDDDCLFYPETLAQADALFRSDSSVHVWLGRIFDRASGKDVIRKWPKMPKEIARANFYDLTSSITLFARNDGMRFDLQLGVGATYGANEDTDFILRHLAEQHRIVYHPSLEVWHPQPGQINSQKAAAYGFGFGALVRKHGLWKLYCLALVFHFAKALLGLLHGNVAEFRLRTAAIQGRVRGVFAYKEVSAA